MNKIIIKRNDSAEYEVPAGLNSQGETEIYYTDDKEDAIATAEISNPGVLNCNIQIRSGTYNKDQ